MLIYQEDFQVEALIGVVNGYSQGLMNCIQGFESGLVATLKKITLVIETLLPYFLEFRTYIYDSIVEG